MAIKHPKTVDTTQVPDPTQAKLDEQIALGNYPPGTLLADIALGSDHNADHIITLTMAEFDTACSDGNFVFQGLSQPLIVGGTAVGSNVTYKSTTGAGTSTGIAHQFVGGTNGATVLVTILNNGRVGRGTAAPDASMDIVDPVSTNQLRLGTSKLDATGKEGGLVVGHYTNAEEPLVVFGANLSSSANIVAFGGGSGTGNTATEIRHYVAATTTTLVGTQMLTTTTTGHGIGVTPTRILSLKAGGSTTRAQAGGVVADYFTDVTVGGAEADIYSITSPASILAVNGDKLLATFGGNFVTGGTELTQLKVKFDATGATTLWDSTALAPATGTTSWRVSVEIIRVSATVVRYSVSLNTSGATGYVYCTVGELTGLTLTGTNILKITGLSSGVGSGTGDIIGKMGFIQWSSAA